MNFRWTIKLFAGLPERLGMNILEMELPAAELTVANLKQAIAEACPEHDAIISISFIARNHSYSADDQIVSCQDELALLPPVSGGEEFIHHNKSDKSSTIERYRITTKPITSDEVLEQVISPDNGASIAFVGTTREWTHGKRTVMLEYEAYEPMAIATMRQIGDELTERWPGTLCAITHRIGVVELAEISVVIAVSAPHRESCYEASRYAIERLKQIVPIWKKEIWEDGSEWKGHQLGPWNPINPLS